MRNNTDAPPRVEEASPDGALPIAPSLAPALNSVQGAGGSAVLGPRILWVSLLASLIGVAAALLATLLSSSIAFITQLAFHGTFSFAPASPADNALGAWVIGVPVLGALVVGVMARYGSAAIRGHGIPEAMEQILFNQSRIPARVLLLKPLSAVISIGTGGPFGSEGPIIATGGALGSLVGQLVEVSADERKTLLAAGAAGGMAATFGAPVAAVLLAIELLLFEYRPRSLIPVTLASVAAAGTRLAFYGTAPAFVVRDLPAPDPRALLSYVLVGVIAGLASVWITRAVYAVEDGFERLPIHWMWWPALGAVVVGAVGWFAPRTLGVGYANIEETISGTLTGRALAVVCVCKLVSWLFSLGSGTSGGTLAPLLTIGGGLGAGTAAVLAAMLPAMHVDVRLGAVVGMSALFAGASRAPLASVIFAFEATRQPLALLPLLAGSGAAYLISCSLMRTSIMTEKIARRGRPIASEYSVDHLEQVLVRDVGLRPVATLLSSASLVEVHAWLRSRVHGAGHHGFPVLDQQGKVLGVVTQRELLGTEEPSALVASLLSRPPLVIHPAATLRDAADTMVRENIGRLPVVDEGRLVGIVTRSDLLGAHRGRLLATVKHPPVAGRRIGARRPAAPAHF